MTDRGSGGGMFAVTVRRPVAILMVTLTVMVFGMFSYRLLPVELMPDINYPSLTVRTEYPGAAPEEVEENVTRPIEEALGVVGGLVRLSSVSRAGLSDVTLEFTWDTSMGQAWQEVTERLDSVFLPEDAGKPLILRYDPSLDPVMLLALASDRPEDQSPSGLKRLRTYAEQRLKRELEQLPGVAAVRVLGGLEEQISVDLDEQRLRRTGLSIQEVVRRLEVENVNVAGGDIKEGDTRYLVRTLNEFRTLDEIADLVVAERDGREIRLRDVGTVTSGWKDRQVITRLDGSEAVEIELQKEADANLVTMARTVREAVEGEGGSSGPGLAAGLPEGWRLEIVSDRSRFIEASVREVRNTAILGGLLAVVVLYLFLRDPRATSVISVAIPVSLAASFAPMYLAGLSLNIMSLGGLALGIGMLVDSGIVVVESIARCREEGDPLQQAVVRGTAEVGTAVVASVLTTVAVFLPLVFVEGVAGQVFGDLALTVVFALLFSLLVAVFLVPALTARLTTGPARDRAPLRSRVSEIFRYRSLPRPDAPAWARAAAAAAGAFPWLAAAALVAASREVKPAAAALALTAAAAGLGGLLASFIARIRRGDRLAAALAHALVFDPALLVLEGAWLLLLGAVAAVFFAAATAVRAGGAVLGLVFAPAARATGLLLALLDRTYPRLVRASVRRPAPVLLGAAAALALTAWGLTRMDRALIPEVHQGEFDLAAELPVGTPLEETLAACAPIERAAIDDPRVRRALLRVGADPSADSEPEEGENTAHLLVALAPEGRPAGFVARVRRAAYRIAGALRHAAEGGLTAVREERVIADLRRVAAGIPDLQAQVSRPVLFSFHTPIEIEIQGYDLAVLRRLGERVREELRSIPGLSDVESTARPGSPEVQITYDRDALVRYGLDLRDVADLVRTKVQGSAATQFRRRERRIDIVVRLGEKHRATVRQLRNLVVNPGGAVPVPLSAVARIEIAEGPADIRRVGQRRVALVRANLNGLSLGRAGELIRRRLERLEWPEGTSWRLAGQAREMQRSLRSLWIALGLSVFLVYVVMASQFESLLHPLLIMITVPLALFGVVVVLGGLGIPISVVVFLGMIMLAGIVVNNAIVLVDYVNRLRRRGLSVEDALVEGGRVRLRPILMTTATTVLGLLPMSLGLGDGAEIRTPMALTVIAGLLSSTLLTLIVLPTLYSGAERVAARIRSGRGAEEVPPPVPAGMDPP
ncbi:MAG: efflux RND transporter permease subunit [Acidobacteria bacterium]|nr:MAG: efflux RND transporter permease subunit [Acidobacteriota bacterium]